MKQLPKVSVCMITYGHEQFIEEAINGVLMQQGKFKIELIIANDCSPDKTEEIIQNIISKQAKGNLIKYYKHDKNIGMMPNFIFALEHCTGNYIALCDGDDYWTDPLKLQMQIDYLFANATLVGCFHDAVLVNQASEIISLEYYHPTKNYFSQEDCLIRLGSSYATCSLMFKSETFQQKLPDWFIKRPCDEFLDLLITQKGVLGYFPRNLCAYRVHDRGIWQGSSLTDRLREKFRRKEILYNSLEFRKKYENFLKQQLDYLWSEIIKSNVSLTVKFKYFIKMAVLFPPFNLINIKKCKRNAVALAKGFRIFIIITLYIKI